MAGLCLLASYVRRIYWSFWVGHHTPPYTVHTGAEQGYHSTIRALSRQWRWHLLQIEAVQYQGQYTVGAIFTNMPFMRVTFSISKDNTPFINFAALSIEMDDWHIFIVEYERCTTFLPTKLSSSYLFQTILSRWQHNASVQHLVFSQTSSRCESGLP